MKDKIKVVVNRLVILLSLVFLVFLGWFFGYGERQHLEQMVDVHRDTANKVRIELAYMTEFADICVITGKRIAEKYFECDGRLKACEDALMGGKTKHFDPPKRKYKQPVIWWKDPKGV